jgi:hypothetical protein
MAMVEVMGQHLGPALHLRRGDYRAGAHLLDQGCFQFVDPAFHAAVVRWVIGRRVQRDDEIARQHRIDRGMIEVGAVIAFEHHGWSVLPEQSFQPVSHDFSHGTLADQWGELVARGEVLNLMQMEPAAGSGEQLRIIERPNQTRHMPRHTPQLGFTLPVEFSAGARDQGVQIAARDLPLVLPIESPDTTAAVPPVAELPHLELQLFAW